MKWLLAFLCVSAFAHAETSRVIPVFLEAAEIYQSPSKDHLYLGPETRAIISILKAKNIPPHFLTPYLQSSKSSWELPENDKYDQWIQNPKSSKSGREVPALSLHASKLDVVNASEYSDDIYAYFFITDGVIPTGKVTSVYKGISSGQAFFFDPQDRAVFPLIGIAAKAPTNHLIIDYGIVESDGDDIKRLQQLSSIIIDIAITVYSSQYPQSGQVITSLRKEIKALADLLISFNHDDRLVTDSIGFTTDELASMLSERTYVDIKKSYKKEGNYNNWEYDLHFRLLR